MHTHAATKVRQRSHCRQRSQASGCSTMLYIAVFAWLFPLVPVLLVHQFVLLFYIKNVIIFDENRGWPPCMRYPTLRQVHRSLSLAL